MGDEFKALVLDTFNYTCDEMQQGTSANDPRIKTTTSGQCRYATGGTFSCDAVTSTYFRVCPCTGGTATATATATTMTMTMTTVTSTTTTSTTTMMPEVDGVVGTLGKFARCVTVAAAAVHLALSSV